MYSETVTTESGIISIPGGFYHLFPVNFAYEGVVTARMVVFVVKCAVHLNTNPLKLLVEENTDGVCGTVAKLLTHNRIA